MVMLSHKDVLEMLTAAYLNCSNVDQRDGARKVLSALFVLMRRNSLFDSFEEQCTIENLKKAGFKYTG